MKRIQIYHQNKCECICFEKQIEYANFRLIEQENKVYICLDNQKMICLKPVRYKEYVFIPVPIRTFSICTIKNQFIVGRDKNCNCQINDLDISSIHFSIEKKEDHFYLKDEKSTNGVYVNGSKVNHIRLKDGDEIWITKYQFFYFGCYLMVPIEQKKEELKSHCMQIEPVKKERKQVLKIERKPIVPESYIWENAPVKTPLFQSIGSSFMILTSSLLSFLILYFMHPEQKNQLIATFFMSCSMAVGFLFFGLYNRKQSFQNSMKQIQFKEHQYFDYLNMLYESIKEKEQKINVLLEEQFNDFMSHQYQFDDVLVDYSHQKYSYFQLKEPPFQYLNSDMDKNIKKWIQMHEIRVQIPIYLKQIKALQLTNSINGWMQVLCECQNDLKYVLVGNSFKECYFLSHPKCMEEGYRLWIFDEKSKQLFQKRKKENQNYLYIFDSTICIDTVYKPSFHYQFNYSIYQKDCLSTGTEKNISFKERKNTVQLEVELGMDEQGEKIILNLDETKDGVHGLIAGTTGSGKSELLYTILIQLAMNNSCSLFQFVLIDFKGGAFSQSFEDFPHCVATITNLDRDLDRFLVLMNCLIDTRQKQLKHAGVNHINVYNLKKNRKMSHLMIVIDEFAQLKEQARQAMVSIKEMARIGRSLGIHLILSTQKPMGIIDEQIWANTSFHICMKVNSKQDSMEVLHNVFAYHLKEPGQFILQRQSCVKGHSFYLNEKEMIYQFVNDYDEVLYEKKETETKFERLKQKILSYPESRVELFLPVLSKYPFQNELLVYEDIKDVKQIPFDLYHGQSLYILTDDFSWIPQIFFYFKDPVFTYKLSIPYTDRDFKDMKALFECTFIKEPFTLIVLADSEFLENVESFQKKNIRLIVLTKNPIHFNTGVNRFKCCWNVHSNEYIKTFFTKSHLCNENWIEIQNELYPFQFQKRDPFYQKKKKVHFESHVYLGICQKEWVYWDTRRKLLIVYAQKSLEKDIKDKIKDWPCLDKIQMIHIPSSIAFFQSQEYILNQYEWDILWFGPGYLEYGFYIKRKNIPASFLMFWDERKAYSLE